MKKLLRLFASLAGLLNPRQIHSTKTGRASGRTGRKSLIINDQTLHPPPKSSGNVRFCTLTVLTFPEPIRSNPKLRAETCASGRAGVENPNGNTGLNGRCNTCVKYPKVLHRVAVCCSVLHRVAAKKFASSRNSGERLSFEIPGESVFSSPLRSATHSRPPHAPTRQSR